MVEFKEGFGSVPAWRYLGPQVAGGTRLTKSGERQLIEAGIMRSNEVIVPGQGIKRDAYGNVPGSIMNRILSDLGARADKATEHDRPVPQAQCWSQSWALSGAAPRWRARMAALRP